MMGTTDLVIDFIRQWYWIPLLIVYLGVILTILIENRNPTKTIAWLLVIILLPVLGMVIYYLFGQKFVKVKDFRSGHLSQYEGLMQHWGKHNPILESKLQSISAMIGSLGRVFVFLANQKVAPPSLGNSVKLLTNGEEKFPALLEAIRSAKHHIHLEYYIFEPDQIGQQVLDLLVQKAEEGVEVRLIVDAFGSPKLSRRMRKLTQLGPQAVVFLPVGFTSLANSNYRNHRKVAIIDGNTAFIGGINISDYYINEPGSNALYWRDTAIRIQGSAINTLQAYFWMDWCFAGGDAFAVDASYFYPVEAAKPGDAALTFAFSDPGSASPFCMEALLIAISEAQESIQLCTPYFIPSEELSTALQLAAASGISVELMLPAKGDSFIVQHASISFLKPLLERGVKVYLYTKGFVHAKTVSIDHKLAMVGTVNLDTRSFYINFETSAIISDPAFSRSLETQFEIDKSVSRKVTIEDWRKRPKLKRGLDSVCRLLAPLL